ncbi:hypothetical protein M2280_004372 [Prescottella agglutinans]|uniref:DNA-binding protein n=1 Tax=Prescottella agglutinans TaxID=1644129 RepID=A0ABT6MFM6_9NOCA|nr:hypothetical protein [Prescottella agglutinans]
MRFESIQSAADRYAIHHQTVRRAIKAGLLTEHRVAPACIRLSIDQVDEVFRNHFARHTDTVEQPA